MGNATCQLCHQDMDGNSCTDTAPIRGPWAWPPRQVIQGFHHQNCDQAHCVVCRNQLLICEHGHWPADRSGGRTTSPDYVPVSQSSSRSL
jgi:hypothetical protein